MEFHCKMTSHKAHSSDSSRSAGRDGFVAVIPPGFEKMRVQHVRRFTSGGTKELKGRLVIKIWRGSFSHGLKCIWFQVSQLSGSVI